MTTNKRILITGAGGYVGKLLFDELQEHNDAIFGIDLRPGERIEQMDIRDPALDDMMRDKKITHVVHLASIVQPGLDPKLEFDIDVNGTQNVLDACLGAGVEHLTVTSSGAAYGYHADNPDWIAEDDPLRGNDEFSYSRHKRLVEVLLAEYRREHPELKQLVLRPGTVIGAHTSNMITPLFTGRFVLGLRGYRSPFVFIWDQDLVRLLAYGVNHSVVGIFNVAGDGCLTVDEIGAVLGKPVVHVPVWLIKSVLRITKPLKLTRYGPDQVMFMQYRPVLANQRLKSDFGCRPQKSSREAFELFASHL